MTVLCEDEEEKDRPKNWDGVVKLYVSKRRSYVISVRQLCSPTV